MSAEYAHELEDFRNRWKKDVFAFCWAFLGDGAAAEEATCEAFAALYRDRELQMNDREMPPRLLGLALRATEKYRNGPSQSLQTTSRLEGAIQRLPRRERAVVIMRNLLHMEWASLALAADLSRAQAHKAWMRGIVQLNDLLQRDFLKERH
jgi:DNA-directed RNA polymerase specialized sigma24 family protein